MTHAPHQLVLMAMLASLQWLAFLRAVLWNERTADLGTQKIHQHQPPELMAVFALHLVLSSSWPVENGSTGNTTAFPGFSRTEGSRLLHNLNIQFADVWPVTSSEDCMNKSLTAILSWVQGIRVNAINPGEVLTPIFKTSGGMSDREVEEYTAKWSQLNPLGRIGQPQDIAHLAIFLADNEKAGWITGQCIVVDGGARSFACQS